MTALEQDLDRWASESTAASGTLVGLSGELTSTLTRWPEAAGTWTGSAAVAFEAVEGRLRDDIVALGEAVESAAGAFRELAAALQEAVVLAGRAQSTTELADEATRRWRVRRDEWDDHSGRLVDPPPATDPGAEDRRRGEALRAEAERVAAEAAAVFAARLDAASAGIPTGDRRSLSELASEFGGGVMDSVRGLVDTVWGFSTLRMLVDGDGWRDDVAGMGKGLAAAVEDPGAALRGLLDLDTWGDSPARAAGRLAPDLVAGAVTAGAGAGAARAGTTATRVRRTQSVAGITDAPAPGRLPMTPPRPDDPTVPIINLTATGDRMGDNARRIVPIDGHTDVAIHGSPTAFGTTPYGPALSPSTVADLIVENPKFDGGPIRLISCRSGATSCGSAGTLADELGAEVLAPNTTIWVYPDGRLVLGEGRFAGTGLEITDPGEWIRFAPGER